MWKKWIIGFFLCASILTFSTVSHATLGESTASELKSGVNIDKKEVDTSKYELIDPEKRAYTSKDKVTFINGKAPSETRVTIKVYGTTDLTRKNFDLQTLPKKDDYIESYSEEVVAGNMGFFDKQLDLVSGINKIVLNFNVEGVEDIEIIVFVQTNLTKTTEKAKLTNIIPKIK
jgi:hypothetical protein